MLGITGTFLDAVLNDIPSNNWGPDEWARDFDAMKAIGIDTVILIRAGLGDQMMFDSKVLKSHFNMRPCYTDWMDVFLTLCEQRDMKFFYGTYNSKHYCHIGQPEKEIELNLELCKEFLDLYGHRKALQGWYMSIEIGAYNPDVLNVYEALSDYLRQSKNLPIMISPGVRGKKEYPDDFLTPQQHEETWAQTFARLEGLIDIVAFQDGHMEFCEMPEYFEINRRLANKHGIEFWSNVETFERGMPIRFLPIAWQNMRYKMEQSTQAQKLITFEFSHFLSPNSMYSSAHELYKRYKEYISDAVVSGGK